MNRQHKINYIEEKLSLLTQRVAIRGSLNLLELNTHVEFFYRDLLNILHGWNLENLNTTKKNTKSFDLKDTNGKVFIQVSATANSKKINQTLSSITLDNYQDYTLKFLFIKNDCKRLRDIENLTLQNIKFNPKLDILDTKTILTTIQNLKIESLCKLPQKLGHPKLEKAS